MDRRAFIKGLFGVAAVAATPKIFIDMGAAWAKRESGFWLREYDAEYLTPGMIHRALARLEEYRPSPNMALVSQKQYDALVAHINAHARILSNEKYNDGTGQLGKFQEHIQAHAKIIEVS